MDDRYMDYFNLSNSNIYLGTWNFSIYDGTIHVRGYYDVLMISISLVAGVCVSLPALIWALHVLYTLHKQGGQISAFILLLILSDLAELLLSAIIASYLINGLVKFSAARYLKYLTISERIVIKIILIRLFFTFRTCGLFLHQLVALKHTLSLRNQLCSARVCSPLCATISCIILWLIAFGLQFAGKWYNVIFSFLPSFMLDITCVLTCKASPASDHIKPGSAVLIVSTFTLITFCAPASLVLGFKVGSGPFYFDELALYFFTILTSLRVISDPLLCVLVCKEQLRVHKQQTHTDMNTDQRSV